MRRGSGSLIVVVAVVALALAATLDAFRDDGSAEPRAAPVDEERGAAGTRRAPRLDRRPLVSAQLREAGVRGALILIDERCRYWALELPELEWRWDETGPSTVCTLSSSITTRDAFGGPGKLWEPEGRLIGACRRNLVDVYASERDSFYRMRGCTPAWRPDGRVTYVRGDQVLELEPECSRGTRRVTVGRRQRCGRVVVGPRDIERAVRAAERPFCPRALTHVCGGPVLRSLEIQDVGWLSSTRVAVHARFAWAGAGERDLVAVFERRRLVARPTTRRRFDDLRVSPNRTYVVVRGGRPRVLVFLDRDGRVVAENPLAGGHHVAWSPDERWTVIATGASTYVFPTDELELAGKGAPLRAIRLDIFAADLSWQ
jgi:hypothetical protein